MQERKRAKTALRDFLTLQLIPFMVIGSSLLPNPDPLRIGTTVHLLRRKIAPRIKHSKWTRNVKQKNQVNFLLVFLYTTVL